MRILKGATLGLGPLREHGAETLQSLMAARLGMLYLLLGVGVFAQVLQVGNNPTLVLFGYGLLACAFAFNGLFALLPDRVSEGFWPALGHVLFDIFLISAWIHVAGERENLYSLLYLVQILFVALTLYQRAALMAAGLAATGFGIVLLAAPPEGALLLWTVNMTLFVLLGFVGGYLSEELHRTSERLAEHEVRLKQNEKLAAVGQLAAGIAHEIRNPLAGMSASIEMLRSSLPLETVGKENQKLMDIALREIHRLNQLISEFLDFVKPHQMQVEPVDLSPLIAEVVFALRHPEHPGRIKSLKGGIAVRQDIELKEVFEPSVAVANSAKLKQVIWNLVINAIQAMDKSGVIEVGCRQDGPQRVVFWVQDQGQGMSEKTLTHLFEPFFTTKEKGTGLGLATAYKIVEAMRGEIRVESKVGQGTRFEVLLPSASRAVGEVR